MFETTTMGQTSDTGLILLQFLCKKPCHEALGVQSDLYQKMQQF
jgi:hypothetical protein